MRKGIVLLLFFLPLAAFAQDSNLGNWINYFGNKKINDKLNWHHEVQYRNYNIVGDLEQLLLRTGVGYNLSENNNNVLLGYGFIMSDNYTGFSDEKVRVNEHRIFQQFITKQHFGRFYLQHRFRFEQRFVEEDFKMRFRYFLGLNVALNNKALTDNTVYLSAYNEIFINDRGAKFDRNRVYGAVGYKLNKTIKFELGYMNQFFETKGRDQLNMNVFVSF